MKDKNIKENRGFALLYAILISSMLLAIGLGVANVSFKEAKFSTSAKDTNDAFFAADTGAECALFYDRVNPTSNAFDITPINPITCAGNTITVTPSGSPATFWIFTVPLLGNASKGCAKVTVDKTTAVTEVISKGYNVGSGGTPPNATCTQSANSVEREIDLTY